MSSLGPYRTIFSRLCGKATLRDTSATATTEVLSRTACSRGNASERVASKLGWILEHKQNDDPASEYVKNCRELVDMMLEFLDGLEEDPDLEEPADDEPSLGWMNPGPSQSGNCGGIDDCEHDDADDEPSLGSGAALSSGNQAHWSQGRSDDVEDVNEDGDGSWANGTVDDEPSLGSTATINQEAWAFGNNVDREQGTTRRFREEPKKPSICNVVPVNGEWWQLEKVD